ncbi:NADH-quinone oxidoreductase subunit J [Chryseolinea sp. H1M3-3]|uniref:NADH-quinone oxidoreductase subunit J family protein n=1 Tax=Chryseolinea sp. H1M3-3 TaxID=3034144 RepID=UPI0023EB9F61|nr:NADH-quinone oxidoreductase subunit J [Chryseolinea sp. H1M3-3]
MFYFFEIVAALSAVALALSRNVFYGALLLIVCLLALAGIYVLAFAEFIAVTQILIYAGGILVVIIFGIMLTTKISEKPLAVEHTYLLSGILAAGGCFGLLIYVLSKEYFLTTGVQQLPSSPVNGIQTIGVSMFSKYVLPFEVAGILLLISLVGASVVASTIKSKKE